MSSCSTFPRARGPPQAMGKPDGKISVSSERVLHMLVLTRKIHESIVIGGAICVSILALDGQRVKLGITAPAEVPVLREELLPSPSPSLEKDEHTRTI